MGRRKSKEEPVPSATVAGAPETQCPHVDNASCGQNTRSLLNPRLWACSQCGTTERVWACLFCSHMGCGRDVGGHALQHHRTTKHPVALEVNDLYIHCYLCNCYVLNDNIYSDLELLRSNMRALATRSFSNSRTRSGRAIRTESTSTAHKHGINTLEEEQDVLVNQVETADTHYKAKLLTKVMTAWRLTTDTSKAQSVATPRETSPVKEVVDRSAVGDSSHDHPEATAAVAPVTVPKAAAPPSVRKRPKSLASGVTGLRNLGNTCYMNSVLQALGHLTYFRECFRQMALPVSITAAPAPGKGYSASTSSIVSPAKGASSSSASRHSLGRQHSMSSKESVDTARRMLHYARQTTIECFNQLTMPIGEQASGRHGACSPIGLNGGDEGVRGKGGRKRGSRRNSVDGRSSSRASADAAAKLSLVQGLHQLFRVTWSGKWTVATPSSLLGSVWRRIPAFHGHEQQDAQEFLSCLLECLDGELNALPKSCVTRVTQPRREVITPSGIIPSTFQGTLLSEVRCQTCSTRTRRHEVFYDVSLDFPDRYQARPVASARSCRRTARPPCEEPCTLTDILQKFVEPEDLGPIFLCNMCLGISKPQPGAAKRRVSRSASMITAGQRYQPAVKRLLLERPPEVLRLHLKRFRWFYSSREKISVHVNYPLELDMRPYCVQPKTPATAAHTAPAGTVPAGEPMETEAGDADEGVSLEDVLDLSGVFGKRSFSSMAADDNEDDDEEKDVCDDSAVLDLTPEDYIYDLSSVVMHHGPGFNRGHYTSYCWNHVARSWVHCNDARLTLCSQSEALQAQAYILFYVRRHGRAGTGYSPFAEDAPPVPPPMSPLSPPFSPSKLRTQQSRPSPIACTVPRA